MEYNQTPLDKDLNELVSARQRLFQLQIKKGLRFIWIPYNV